MRRNEIARSELSDFLRTRRARLSPIAAGLSPRARRRVPGLRREEVAELAGISVTLYTWLEQGRDVRVSRRVLESLAEVLKLNRGEKLQLFELVRGREDTEKAFSDQIVSAYVQHMIDNWHGCVAFVEGRFWDILAWNLAARALFVDFPSLPKEERNFVWLLFTSPEVRSRFVDWDYEAQRTLATFRADFGRYAGDRGFTSLVRRLQAASQEFAGWWVRHDLIERPETTVKFRHPAVGYLTLEFETLWIGSSSEIKIDVLTPASESDLKTLRKLVGSFASVRAPESERRKISATSQRRE